MPIREIQALSAKVLFVWFGSMLAVSGSGLSQEKTATEERGTSLQLIKPAKLIAEGRNRKPVSAKQLLTYRLEEVELPKEIELQIRGQKQKLGTAFRLTVTSELIQGPHLIWVDDAALGATELSGNGIVAFIYDRSILKDGAVIAVSNRNGNDFAPLPERLQLPESFRSRIKPAIIENGNSYTIRTALRVEGSARQPLIQIVLKTGRPFPVGNNVMYVQIGKRFLPFSGFGHLGQTGSGELVVGFTPQEFAELKNGDWLMATYGSPIPSRGGMSSALVWEFGPLDKSKLDR